MVELPPLPLGAALAAADEAPEAADEADEAASLCARARGARRAVERRALVNFIFGNEGWGLGWVEM